MRGVLGATLGAMGLQKISKALGSYYPPKNTPPSLRPAQHLGGMIGRGVKLSAGEG